MEIRYVIFRLDDNKYYAYGTWTDAPIGAVRYHTENEAVHRIMDKDFKDTVGAEFSGDIFEIRKVFVK